LDAKAPERAKLDIFERVNSGVAINRQQMRNALYTGSATRWLRDTAKDPFFRRVTGGVLSAKAMRDREAINRFCAFHLLGWKTYAGDMDLHLARALEQMNGMNETALRNLKSCFDKSMKLNWVLFSTHSFRKSLFETNQHVARTIFNISLFDVFSTLMAKTTERLLDDEIKKQGLRAEIRKLFTKSSFFSSISHSTNSRSSVQDRFSSVEFVLRHAGVLE
jgi:hypothetical protein